MVSHQSMLIQCFKNLATSYSMQVYVEVSKNHNIPIEEVIRGKFKPSIRLLITYYNHVFNLQRKEQAEIEKEQKKHEKQIEQIGG